MKKHVVFLFLTGLTGSVFGQDTITQSSFPVVGSTRVDLLDSNYGVHTIPSAGAAQTWNYATAFTVTDTDAVAFLDPATLPPPFNTDFPNADMAIYSAKDTTAQYFVSQPNGFYLDGFSFHGAGSQPPLDKFDFMPDLVFLPAPLTYGTMHNSSSRVTIIQPWSGPTSPGIKFTQDHFVNVNANAWGTLTTPAGTWNGTVRALRLSYLVDSSFIDITGTGNYVFANTSGPTDTTIQHLFVNDIMPVLIMAIDEDPFNPGMSDGASYLVNIPISVTEVSAVPGSTAYPNPVHRSDHITIRSGKQFGRITVSDAAGRTVISTTTGNADQIVLQTSTFQAGIYFYRLYDASQKIAGSGAFVVAW